MISNNILNDLDMLISDQFLLAYSGKYHCYTGKGGLRP